MTDASSVKTARIRQLNDQLRRRGVGGQIVITRGVEALGTDEIREILSEVARFDDFIDDNDPWGEHDCAALTVNRRRIMFKIDYYDFELQYHSPDASDPAVTRRVLTVMLAEEY
jgi:hypothetical protein